MASMFPKISRDPPTQFSPIGICIYCGSTADLTDEHVIPYGLGGNRKLPESSCRDCATITSRFELKILRGPMRPVRLALKIQSRSKHKGAERNLPLKIRRGNSWESLLLPYEEFPLVLDFVVFSLPGIVDKSFKGGIRIRGHQTFSFGLRPEEVMRKYGADKISAPREYHPTDFAKLVAKIGYGTAIGVGAIDPAFGMPDLVASIIGRNSKVGMWVGTLDEPRVLGKSNLNEVSIHRDEQKNILFARVQILSIVGSPVYGVVLGNLTDPFVKEGFSREIPYPTKRDCVWVTDANPSTSG